MREKIIKFLNEIKTTSIASRDFAQSKIDKINTPEAITEFFTQRKSANNKIREIEACLNWLDKLEQI